MTISHKQGTHAGKNSKFWDATSFSYRKKFTQIACVRVRASYSIERPNLLCLLLQAASC